MADSAVTFLLDNVSQLLQYYVKLKSEEKDQLKGLQDDLRMLKCHLEESANRPNKDKPFRELERQIREVIYEAEDIIDTSVTEAANAGYFNQLINVKLPEQVQSLRDGRVKKLLDKAEKYANTPNTNGSTSVDQSWRIIPRKFELIREENIVGFEDEERTIAGYIGERTKKLDVISIIGMPGLGKTTLAWKIFNRDDIRFNFAKCIWVTVSQEVNRSAVFRKILNEFGEQNMPTLEGDLMVRVRRTLKDATFFLVLDDVWSIDAWNDIHDVLPKNNEMSKVLITSRFADVGTRATTNPDRKLHRLRFLTEIESWKLLQLEICGELDAIEDADFVSMGKSIAKECDGLPLAIVVIGPILRGQYFSERPVSTILAEWNDVLKNLEKYLIKNDEAHDGRGISEVVALSYGTLLSELRNCFLYFAVFPEDYIIHVRTLTRLWIAEGFIQRKQDTSLEEIAEENLKDLVARNLVIVDKRKPNGGVKTCHVHDVIRAFCISQATEQNLFQEIKLSNGKFDPPVSQIKDYRRLCIHSYLPDFLSEKPKGPNVRSILCFNKAPINLDAKHTPYIPDKFILLRVLDSISIKFNKFPNSVAKLIHLRYITLSIDNLEVLPEKISYLWNLQTLVVQTSVHTLKVKANIWSMIQLTHIKTNAAIVLAIKGVAEGEKSKSLLTLSRLSPDCCTQDVFNRVNILKRLGISGKLATLFNEATKATNSRLEKLDALEKLKLVNDRSSVLLHDQLRCLPKSNWFPKHLKMLTLSATGLEWMHISVLGKIGTLEILKLKEKAFTGRSWNVACDGFKKLHFLLIKDTDLVDWNVASAEHFPKLTSLVLHTCGKLKEIPLCVGEQLKMLNIEHLGESAVKSAREIEKSKKQQQKAGFKLEVGAACQKYYTN